MGLGDEIMSLGRAEALFEKTGKPVAICRSGGYAREHDAWQGNPAWDMFSTQKIIDGGGDRPYIKRWEGRRAIYNLDHRPRAGRIWFKESEKEFAAKAAPVEPFAVVAPFVKATASPNKDWGYGQWQAVIKDMAMPVLQLLPEKDTPVIKGAQGVFTAHFRQAAAIIARARLVLCNEGGTHHMAASSRVPAVVIFGSFTPPSVTGYSFHRNISAITEHGYCGNFDECGACQEALEAITVDMVCSQVKEALEENV